MYNELYHHGVLGMKWGIRRYQNPDGTLTEAGKKKYYTKDGSLKTKYARQKYGALRSDYFNKGYELEKEFEKTSQGKLLRKKFEDAFNKYDEYEMNDFDDNWNWKTSERLMREADQAETKYLRAIEAYKVNALIDKYSDVELSVLATYSEYNGVREDLSRSESVDRLINSYTAHK